MFKNPSALDVAEYFLAKGELEEDLLSHLKLQKLLYYAQGFHLALAGRRLFDEDILAWDHGPVVREVYDRYREFGSNPIPRDGRQNGFPFTSSQKDTLDQVFMAYGQFSAWRLRQLTHDEPPWQETPRNGVIAPSAMKKYFKTQVVTF